MTETNSGIKVMNFPEPSPSARAGSWALTWCTSSTRSSTTTATACSPTRNSSPWWRTGSTAGSRPSPGRKGGADSRSASSRKWGRGQVRCKSVLYEFTCGACWYLIFILSFIDLLLFPKFNYYYCYHRPESWSRKYVLKLLFLRCFWLRFIYI